VFTHIFIPPSVLFKIYLAMLCFSCSTQDLFFFWWHRGYLLLAAWKLLVVAGGIQFPIVVQSLSCVRLCHTMDCTTPGFPVLHHLLESSQSHAQ